jgi:hypothetical protein
MEARNRVNCVANEMKEAIQHAVEEIEPEVLI